MLLPKFLFTLANNGVGGSFHQAMVEICKDPTCAIKVNGTVSYSFQSIIGTMKGDPNYIASPYKEYAVVRLKMQSPYS